MAIGNFIFSGLMMGLSCGSMLVGIFVAVRSIAK